MRYPEIRFNLPKLVPVYLGRWLWWGVSSSSSSPSSSPLYLDCVIENSYYPFDDRSSIKGKICSRIPKDVVDNKRLSGLSLKSLSSSNTDLLFEAKLCNWNLCSSTDSPFMDDRFIRRFTSPKLNFLWSHREMDPRLHKSSRTSSKSLLYVTRYKN